VDSNLSRSGQEEQQKEREATSPDPFEADQSVPIQKYPSGFSAISERLESMWQRPTALFRVAKRIIPSLL
jgi:hypothetical protein